MCSRGDSGTFVSNLAIFLPQTAIDQTAVSPRPELHHEEAAFGSGHRENESAEVDLQVGILFGSDQCIYLYLYGMRSFRSSPWIGYCKFCSLYQTGISSTLKSQDPETKTNGGFLPHLAIALPR